MKTVIQLNADGYFVGTVNADESPLEPGVYLIPFGCIETESPQIPEGHIAKWSNGWVFEALPQPEPEPPQPTPEEIHEQWLASAVVTMRQARLALLGAGHLAGVDAAIAAITDDMQRQAAQIEWEYAQTVDRNAPFTQTLALALGLSDADLDALFTAAAAL